MYQRFPEMLPGIIYTDLFDVLKNVFTIFIANFKHILAHLSACYSIYWIFVNNDLYLLHNGQQHVEKNAG